jgi:Tol biopolymer transport system component
LDGPSRGAAWGPDGTIVFATGARDTGLQQVAASGGVARVLTRPNRDRGEADHVLPSWLPGGRALLFTVHPVSGEDGDQRVALLDLTTGTWDTLIEGGNSARYVPTGHLVYAAAGALWGIRFDLGERRTRGAPVELLRPVQVGTFGSVAQFDVGPDGTFLYPRDARSDIDNHVPVWVDRQGRETPLDAPPGSYRHARLSPDGRRLAIAAAGEIFIWDTDRPWSTASRMTFTRMVDWFPVWTPDGRMVFGSWRGGGFSNIYIQAPDRAEAARLTDSPDMQLPTSMTPDGSTLIFHSFTQRLEGLRLDGKGDGRPFVLVETPREERNGVVSPDGRWLAYEGESPAVAGQLDIFVRPFPDVQRSLWQVTSGGGLYPCWGMGGRELFYLKPDGTLVVVPVEGTDGSWRAGPAKDLFRGPYLYQGDGSLGRQYDVSPDGRRFIMLKNARDFRTTPHFVIVQHWLAELERLVPH